MNLCTIVHQKDLFVGPSPLCESVLSSIIKANSKIICSENIAKVIMTYAILFETEKQQPTIS